MHVYARRHAGIYEYRYDCRLPKIMHVVTYVLAKFESGRMSGSPKEVVPHPPLRESPSG